MTFELVLYQNDDRGSRIVEHASTSLLSTNDLRTIAETLNTFSHNAGAETLADQIEDALEAL